MIVSIRWFPNSGSKSTRNVKTEHVDIQQKTSHGYAHLFLCEKRYVFTVRARYARAGFQILDDSMKSMKNEELPALKGFYGKHENGDFSLLCYDPSYERDDFKVAPDTRDENTTMTPL